MASYRCRRQLCITETEIRRLVLIWLVETEKLPEQSNISLEHNAGENCGEEWLRISGKYFHIIEDISGSNR